MEQPKSLKIELNPNTNDWVIPDVHGCVKTLDKLISKINPSSTDTLFFLGDLVNKGPSSIEVLDFLIDLEDSGQKILKVYGNHDLLFLEFFKDNLSVESRTYINPSNFSWNEEKTATYINFLERSFHFIDIEDFLLVHAGFDFSDSKPLENVEAMYSIRQWEFDRSFFPGKRIIYGHLPHQWDIIQGAIQNRDFKIPLDNGCVYFGQRAEMGKLLALNLQSFELMYQNNIEA